jgi:hypothetical protein
VTENKYSITDLFFAIFSVDLLRVELGQATKGSQPQLNWPTVKITKVHDMATAMNISNIKYFSDGNSIINPYQILFFPIACRFRFR